VDDWTAFDEGEVVGDGFVLPRVDRTSILELLSVLFSKKDVEEEEGREEGGLDGVASLGPPSVYNRNNQLIGLCR